MGIQEVLAADVYAMSGGRIGAGLAAAAGLAGVIAGGRALARTSRRPAILSLAAAVFALIGGAIVVATSDSGIGTGNGRGGAYLAVLLGTISLVLGGLAMTRARGH
ncbi:DUF6223 family protein [Actinoplanes sp. NPDC049802]|uniref:DUF6223 family protein n=1 Tax=Actinoplanes sp. NPDC049802 TaxID=3154742 RepID=UPI0033E6A169